MKILEKTVVYLIKNQPNQQIGILRLAKYLFLADYLYAKTFGNGETFTGAYTRYQKGPVPARFYDVLTELKTEGIVNRVGNTILITQKNISMPALPEKEKACLDKVLNDFAQRPLNKVIDAAYSTEPMKELLEAENSLGEILLWKNIEFSKTQKHALLQNDDLDTKFLDSEEYKQSLKDE